MPILTRRIDQVTIVTLDAPDSLNALTIPDLLELRDALSACQDDDAVRVIVLIGAGDRSFCTGTNIKQSPPGGQSFVGGVLKSRRADALRGGYTRLIDLGDLSIWKPMIAAVNGFCLGGGLELALQCDLRIAAESASFGMPEVKLASIPAVGGVQYLLRAIPAAHAMKLALTGDRIDAAQALRIGLVSDVVPADRLLQESLSIAERIAANGPLAVQAVKKLAVETAHLAPKEFVAASNLLWGMLRDTADRVEGRNAFAEKRKPRYRND